MKSGNENFKEWIKNQDQQTRVKRISHIGRTLYAMGVRGTDIKAALAQLSQRCQVMIVRLTDKEILQHTRRRPPQNSAATFHQQNSSDNVNTYNDKGQITQESSKAASKKKRKSKLMKELFGEEDTEDVPSKVNKRLKTNDENGEKEVKNYLSTTVNVNYYNIINTSSTDELRSNDYSHKRKSYTTHDNTILNSRSLPQKKLRIDVSLPNDDKSDIQKDKLVKKSKEGLCLDSNRISLKKTSSKKGSKRKASAKNKTSIESSHKGAKKSLQGKDLEEDPSIKELWSIFGMESPTDRTAKFYSDQSKLSTSSVTQPMTSLGNTLENSMDKAHPTHVIEESKETGNVVPIDKSVENDQPESETVEAFLKISDSFSLANVNSNNPDFTETVCLERREDKNMDPKAAEKVPVQENSNSKVGSIRVKSLVSLMDPQLKPCTNEPSFSSKVVVQSVSNQELSNEELFFRTYRIYFDDLVEAKIPKLGELLHLAIADQMRLNERVKRADQLSSEDLITEEKHRASKDFFDMMKLRGEVFSALCDTIIKKFEPGSKQTLFYALFCRVLKHAGSIDPANERHVLPARYVFRLMLEKHHYKDKEILEALQSDVDIFQETLKSIQEFVAFCTQKINNTTSVIKPTENRASVICNPVPKTQDSQGNRNQNTKFSVSKETISGLQLMLIDPSKLNPNNAKRQMKAKETINKKNLPAQQTSTFNAFSPMQVKKPPPYADIRSNIHPSVSEINANLSDKVSTTNISSVGNRPTQQTSTSNAYSPMQVKKPPPYPDIRSNIPLLASGKNANLSHKVNTPSRLSVGNNIQPKSWPNMSVAKNISVPTYIPSYQLGSSTKPLQHQSQSHYQLPSKNIHIPSQTVTSTNNIGTSSMIVTSPTFHSPPHHLSKVRNSNQPVLPEICITSILNTSASKQLVGTSAQRSSTIRPADTSLRNDSSDLPGGRNIPFGHQQSPNIAAANKRIPNHVKSPPTVRSLVNNVVASMMGIESDQSLRSELQKGNTTNTRSQVTTKIGSMEEPTMPTSGSGCSSPQTPTTPGIAPSNAEVNIPSSSHCHPFIVRRPISGKLKMFFGNNTYN